MFYCGTVACPRRFLGPIKTGLGRGRKTFMRQRKKPLASSSEKIVVCVPLLANGELARAKQTARHRRRYVMSSYSSSSSSASTAPSSASSSEKMVSDLVAVVELLSGHMVEFETSRIYSGRVHEMQCLGYFGDGGGRSGSRGGPRAIGGASCF
jgi:hypothetical protein